MTIFEYLTVSVSIVLSFGVIRLLDGLAFAYRKDRRSWVHLFWAIATLWTHPLFWWNFWSYNGVSNWTYGRFMLSLAPVAFLYSMASTIVPHSPGDVTSWHDHFVSVRRRYFRLFAGFFAAVGLLSWQMLDQPFLHPLRAIQAFGVALFVAVSFVTNERLHLYLALFMIALLTWSLVLFSPPEALRVIGGGR